MSIPPRRSPRRLLAALAVPLALGVAACGSDDPDATVTPSPTASPTDETTPVEIVGTEAGTFDQPIMLLARPGDDALWLAERAGTIRRVTAGDDGALTAVGDPVL